MQQGCALQGVLGGACGGQHGGDTASIQETLVDLLPRVLRGSSVAELRQPWPTLASDGSTGLWWDK